MTFLRKTENVALKSAPLPEGGTGRVSGGGSVEGRMHLFERLDSAKVEPIFPTWARHDEDYHPSRDRDAFLSRSLLRVMDILFSLRAQGRRTSRIPALVALLLLFAWILFIVLAQTTTLLFIATVAAFAVLAAFSGRAIRRVLGGALVAALFSLLLVLPAFFLSTGGGRALFLPWKSFLTMAGVMMLAESLGCACRKPSSSCSTRCSARSTCWAKKPAACS